MNRSEEEEKREEMQRDERRERQARELQEKGFVLGSKVTFNVNKGAEGATDSLGTPATGEVVGYLGGRLLIRWLDPVAMQPNSVARVKAERWVDCDDEYRIVASNDGLGKIQRKVYD